MNADQVKSLTRSAMQVLGPLMVAHGWIPGAELGPDIDVIVTFAGALFAMVGIIWGQIANMKASKLAAVEKMPEVAQIVVTSQKTADAAGPKTVTPVDIAAGNAPPIPNPGTAGLY